MGKKGKKQVFQVAEPSQTHIRLHNKVSRTNRMELNKLTDDLLKLASDVPNKLWDQHVEIQELLKRIIALESNANTQSERKRAELISSFETWLSENGVVCDGLKIAEFPGYDLGLKALKPLKEDSLVMTVPSKVMLTAEDTQKSILKGLVEKDPLLKRMLNVRLSMLLLTEKAKQDSFWKPYIDILPSGYTTVLFFSTEDMAMLKGSPVFERALILFQNIARQYSYFYKLIHTSDDEAAKLLRDSFTFNQYRWAVSTVMTRENTIISTSDSESATLALIPLWDMCNHSAGKIKTDYNPDLQRAECYAMKDFAEGDQFFIFYGVRTNSALLLHNGFVYPNNILDYLTIPLGISSGDQLKKEKLELLDKLQVAQCQNGFQIDYGDEPIGDALLAFARVFCMTKDELTEWAANPDITQLLTSSCSVDGPITRDLNKRAYTFLNMRFNLILSTYKSKASEIDRINEGIKNISISEDDLKADKSTIGNRNVIQQLKSAEKLILEQAILHSKKQMELFST